MLWNLSAVHRYILQLETSNTRLTVNILGSLQQTKGCNLTICLFLKVLRTRHGRYVWLTRNTRCCMHSVAQLKWAYFLLHLFSFVTILHFLEMYPQSVLLKLVFLKKLSFKNVKHNEKWKSQKRRLFTATPLGFPHVSGSPCRLSMR